MKYQITTQKQIRAQFRASYPELSFKKINSDYVCDTRCAFEDYLDSLRRDGIISRDLASRVTL